MTEPCRKQHRRRRPCEITRRDLERHITLFTFLAQIVELTNKQTGVYVEYTLSRPVDEDTVLDYKGVFQGYRAEQLAAGPRQYGEDVDQYLERRRREIVEEQVLDVSEGL